MNKIILLVLIIYNNTKSFIENINRQEYSLICEYKSSNCQYIHSLYTECGALLFDIWLSLDLLLSVSVDFNDYNKFYYYLKKKIKTIDNTIIKIQEEKNKNHILDNQKLLFYVQKIMDHQIIKYNDRMLFFMKECKKKILEILTDTAL
jgi:hypothetical protein